MDSYQNGNQPNPQPPKKRKLAEEISLKEISYPAQLQLCIADIQSDFTTNQRDNINIPLQPNLQSPEFGGPYYPNLYVEGTMNQSLLGQQPFPHQLSPQVLDRIEETVSTSSYQGFQPNPLPPKKRKLAEEISLKEISYPAQRQLCIADIQSDFPKVKTVAARKLYPEAAGYTDGQYYEYPDNFDYSNKRSVMNVYINGVREGSGNYLVCLMIGTGNPGGCWPAGKTIGGTTSELSGPSRGKSSATTRGVMTTILTKLFFGPTTKVTKEILGKVRDQQVQVPVLYKNGHKVAEKRKNRDLEAEDETARKKIAVKTDLIEKKTKNSVPNEKVVATKVKPILKTVKETHPPSSKIVALDRNDMDNAPSSPVKTTKSGRVCKRPRRTDYDDLIKSHYGGSQKVKKSVSFKL